MSDCATPSRRQPLGGLILLLLTAGALPAAASEPSLALGLPIACVPGESCWIVNYVDHDPGPGVRDYACGRATYNLPGSSGHNGTDFAVRDGRAMRSGVAVLAAADGTVVATRDTVADADIKDSTLPLASGGKDCGNGVVVRHGNGWETQYCHLRQGSVAVTTGQRVLAGERLGLVGLSGFTQFPHVHVTVRHAGTVIDPFVGAVRPSGCGVGDAPLWKASTLAKLPYDLNVVYHAGFAGEKPAPGKARNGDYAAAVMERDVPALMLWADLFNVRAGYRLVLSVHGPDGRTVSSASIPIEKDQARLFVFAGQPLQGNRWPAGDYEGRIHLAGGDIAPGTEPPPIAVRVTLR
jgi:murein DD-endopeptidase MepM/ murein hydrolase activator NlpD